MNRILLLRHVESEANRTNVGLGRTDSPPTALGRQQIAATAAALREEPLTRILTSPLTRARQLADAVAADHHLTAEPTDALIELDVGEMEGLPWPLVQERFADFLQAWRGADSVRTPMPGGESLHDVLQRAAPLFDELATDPADGSALLVTHNFVVKMLIVHALAMPPDAWRRVDTGLAGLSEFRLTGGIPTAVRLNDRSHLRAIEDG